MANAFVHELRGAVADLAAVYLFGSRVAGQEHRLHPGSDYDVAFRQNPVRGDGEPARLGPMERFELAARLAAEAGVGAVDLVDVGRPGLHELKLAVLDGELLWASDPDEAIGWAAKTATMANDWLLGERELRAAKIAEFRAYAQRDDPPQG